MRHTANSSGNRSSRSSSSNGGGGQSGSRASPIVTPSLSLKQQLASILMLSCLQQRETSRRSGLVVCLHATLIDEFQRAVRNVKLEEGEFTRMLGQHGQPGFAITCGGFDCSLALAWERHTLLHFPGRPLPGCCHITCTQLAGVSEESLPTQLCSGCRRVRYCSAKCQREAWLAGGHVSVCGTAPT